MNIAVYCGSSSGNDLRFIESARTLVKWIGENGHTLVYGGASKGLMGAVAGAVIEAGGKVIGVIPDVAIIQARKHTGLTQLIETKSMAEHKSKMIESIISDGDTDILLICDNEELLLRAKARGIVTNTPAKMKESYTKAMEMLKALGGEK